MDCCVGRGVAVAWQPSGAVAHAGRGAAVPPGVAGRGERAANGGRQGRKPVCRYDPQAVVPPRRAERFCLHRPGARLPAGHGRRTGGRHLLGFARRETVAHRRQRRPGGADGIPAAGSRVTGVAWWRGSIVVFTQADTWTCRPSDGTLERCVELQVPGGTVFRDNRGGAWVCNGTGVLHGLPESSARPWVLRLLDARQLSSVDRERYTVCRLRGGADVHIGLRGRAVRP